MRGISIAYPSLTPSVNSYGSPSHQRHPVQHYVPHLWQVLSTFTYLSLLVAVANFKSLSRCFWHWLWPTSVRRLWELTGGGGGRTFVLPPPAPGIFWGFLKKFSVRPGAMRLWGMRDKKMWETCVYSPLQNSQKYIAICRLRGSLCLKRLTKKKYNYWMRFKRRKNSFIWVKFI